ncbi:hypothetical protein A6046_04270 [[Haemophilus] ducreyi]|uniref:Outer membrane protein n=2 Tax=Haemophilus ducreyi TaxID=730 RepID=Q7VKM7_HAEDU|nr:hypothetical protein [[Haemophilus] ducreyi]AAP96596.1 hypothetical protein HD_1856 [[Haemophilus] ducreyi 35000HP]AKO31440.1 membrane protein [[Haemophilus] ducreyi]AKO32894.1 membrane protein [[Haemophilus] ducreyi]AKO34341.1 membrane protein [[Haemophilus] ducreyi]AKO35785.1 membrane protein [[Haemophilus] ducreyi]
MKKLSIITVTLVTIVSSTIWAKDVNENSSADYYHQHIKNKLNRLSNEINGWLGETDPNQPASAMLWVMLDTEWNRYGGVTYKPRVRGKVRLPVLQKHLRMIFGDEELDYNNRDKNRRGNNYDQALKKYKKYDRHQVRRDNNALGLNWSDGIERLGIDTDFDVGLRAGTDLYGRLRLVKEWTWQSIPQYSTKLEQIYRYGRKSKHYLHTNLGNKWQENEETFINNHTFLEYTKQDTESLIWGNSLHREHNWANYKRLSYGIYAGGSLNKQNAKLNSYGPFITYRQPILSNWLFIQPEVSFYNNKDQKKSHFINAFVRLEAVF